MLEGTARRGGSRGSADNGVDVLRRRITELEGELRDATRRTVEELHDVRRRTEDALHDRRRTEEELHEASVRNAQLREELREDRLKTEQLREELREAKHQITELWEHRDRAESPAAKAEEVAPELDVGGMRTETKAALDSDLQRAATSAANTGRLVLENLDQPVFTNDIAGSADNFHRAASVLDSVEMRYPMVHMAPAWAPLDLGNSVFGEARSWRAGTAAPISPAEIIDLARHAHHEAQRVGLRFDTVPVVRARRSFAALLTKFLKTLAGFLALQVFGSLSLASAAILLDGVIAGSAWPHSRPLTPASVWTGGAV